MRHVPLKKVLKRVFADEAGQSAKKRLQRAQKAVSLWAVNDRQGYITRNGSEKWSSVKSRLTGLLGNKCWYTEVGSVGSDLAIDHFRPICKYWFLAFDPTNYRVSCQFANSPHHNPIYSSGGGKGIEFPLRKGTLPAIRKKGIHRESPVILDPCNARDCEIVAFQADGRPVINPKYASDEFAVYRLDKSKLLLNLDHPDFNSKREVLSKEIGREVRACETPGIDPELRSDFEESLARRIQTSSEFSTAARYYLSNYRYLDWVEAILATSETP